MIKTMQVVGVGFIRPLLLWIQVHPRALLHALKAPGSKTKPWQPKQQIAKVAENQLNRIQRY